MHPLFVAGSLILLSICTTRGQVLIDPRARYANFTYGLPNEPPTTYPVLEANFTHPPDHGESSYVGHARLQGRHALITGGDSGIGRAVAIAFVREGAKVAISYLPEEEPDAESLVKFLAKENKTVIRLPGDLRNETFCAELVKNAHDQLQGLDLLVSNAGYPGQQTGRYNTIVSNLTTTEFDRIIQTNVYPPFFLARAAVPLLPPGSSIIHTASGSINSPYASGLTYIASKAFVAYWSNVLALQMLPYGIRVNAVLPAPVYSALWPAEGYTTECLTERAAQTPAGRLEQPAELAPLYVDYAASDVTYASGGTWSTPE